MLSAAILYLLLSVQAGGAACLVSVAILCLRAGCYGLAESMFGIGLGVFVAIVTFTLLSIHHANTKKVNPQSLESQARVQWIWLSISFFILANVDF